MRRRLLYLKIYPSPTPPPSPAPSPSASSLLINNFNCIHSQAAVPAPLYYSRAKGGQKFASKTFSRKYFLHSRNVFDDRCNAFSAFSMPCLISSLPCTDDVVARFGFVFRFQFAHFALQCVCAPWLEQTLALITRQQQRLTSIW